MDRFSFFPGVVQEPAGQVAQAKARGAGAAAEAAGGAMRQHHQQQQRHHQLHRQRIPNREVPRIRSLLRAASAHQKRSQWVQRCRRVIRPGSGLRGAWHWVYIWNDSHGSGGC